MHGNSLKTLRQELLKQRKDFAAGAKYSQASATLIASLNQFLASEGAAFKSIALYWPIQYEIDLRPALMDWAKGATGRLIALPVARPDKHLDFYQWQEGDSLVTSEYGVPEPDPSNVARPAIHPDCILIPCVGWSSSTTNDKKYHWRLGYGGGYFDRTLSTLRQKNPKLICVGIGFDWQKLDDSQWAAQTHDEPLDLLITESGLLR